MSDAAKQAAQAEAGFHEEVLAEMDRLEERSMLLEHYLVTAAAVLSIASTPAAERPRREMDAPVIAALVVAQAILDSADVCTQRLERIADTLDDLVEAIERSTEGGEVSAC